MHRLAIIALTILTLAFGAGAAWALEEADCIACHKAEGGQAALVVKMDGFLASVHGKEQVSCTDCHVDIEEGEQPESHTPGRIDCAQCHDQADMHGANGQGVAPRCWDCHGDHYIVEVTESSSPVNPANLARTCAVCHPHQAGRPDYFSWLPSLRVNTHGKQDFAGVYSRDNCLACHQDMGAHGTDAVLNEQTCARCHGPNAEGKSRLAGFFHPHAQASAQPGTFAAGIIDMVFLGVMFFGGRGIFHDPPPQADGG